MKLGICTIPDKWEASRGWKTAEIGKFSELAALVKSSPYTAVSRYKDGHRTAANVEELGNVLIFDVDNDPGGPILTMDQARDLLNKQGVSYLIIPSKSHQLEKTTPKGEVKPPVDRYRVIVPTTAPLDADRDLYRLAAEECGRQLGILPHADHGALVDLSRFYFPSPDSAQVIVSNPKKAFDTVPAKEFAAAEKQRLDAEREAAREKVLAMFRQDREAIHGEMADMPLLVDMDAMTQLPLPEIYQALTGCEIKRQGSYLMAPGFLPGTSEKRQSLTFIQDGPHWLWHDFKPDASGNVITMFRHMGKNVLEAAQALEKQFNVTLVVPNLTYYKQALEGGLTIARNDRALEEELKNRTGAGFVKLEGDRLKIGNKEFQLSQFGYQKIDIINRFRENRNPSSGPRPG